MSEQGRGNVSLRPSELVIAAIHNLEERRGSSPNDIINFISKKYELGAEQVKNHVERALKRGVCFGVLSENDGLYRLLDVNVAKIANEAGCRKRRSTRRRRKSPKPGKSQTGGRRCGKKKRRKSRLSGLFDGHFSRLLRGKGKGKRGKRNPKKKCQKKRSRKRAKSS